MQWVDVRDALPKDKQKVLVALRDNKTVRVCKYLEIKEHGVFVLDPKEPSTTVVFIIGVVAWMPLDMLGN